MKILIFLLLLKIDPLPQNAPIVDTFDSIEVNHRLNKWGVENMVQVIAWDWCGAHNTFHVEWWKSMNDAHTRTKEGEEKWNKRRREIADKIKLWSARKDFLNATYYRGDFTGGALYPVKNNRTGYYEIKFRDNYGGVTRIIRSKHFTESWTNNDPESDDRKIQPPRNRRGLTNDKETLLLHLPALEKGLMEIVR